MLKSAIKIVLLFSLTASNLYADGGIIVGGGISTDPYLFANISTKLMPTKRKQNFLEINQNSQELSNFVIYKCKNNFLGKIILNSCVEYHTEKNTHIPLEHGTYLLTDQSFSFEKFFDIPSSKKQILEFKIVTLKIKDTKRAKEIKITRKLEENEERKNAFTSAIWGVQNHIVRTGLSAFTFKMERITKICRNYAEFSKKICIEYYLGSTAELSEYLDRISTLLFPSPIEFLSPSTLSQESILYHRWLEVLSYKMSDNDLISGNVSFVLFPANYFVEVYDDDGKIIQKKIIQKKESQSSND